MTRPVFVEPVILTDGLVALKPLGVGHAAALGEAARDGELWRLRVPSVPEPGAERAYIDEALSMEDRVPFAVRDADGTVIGSTSYHDILPLPRRVEIGYTWYARRAQRTHVNTACKLLLLEMPSRRWAAPPSAGGPTSSTARLSGRSSGWGPAVTVSCAGRSCGETGRSPTP